MKKNSRVLGKGLNALININEINNKETLEIDINDIIPNKNQPRKKLDSIDELAFSVKEHGILQPIMVFSIGENKYQIIAGERRWRAAKIAGLKKIPVTIKNSTSVKDKFIISLIENLQREDLNPVEEAEAYQELISKFSLSIEYLSKIFGKDRTTITNIIRLLNLPLEIKEDLRKGLIQAGHARPLINIQDKKLILDIRNKIINNKISVRDVENLINNYRNKGKTNKKPVVKEKNANIHEIEEKFQQKFSTKVKIKGDNDKGKIIIEYYTQSDLDRFLEILNL